MECLRRNCADVDGPEHGDPSWVHVDRGQYLYHSDFRARYGGTREYSCSCSLLGVLSEVAN